jgi:hypothetical protein
MEHQGGNMETAKQSNGQGLRHRGCVNVMRPEPLKTPID